LKYKSAWVANYAAYNVVRGGAIKLLFLAIPLALGAQTTCAEPIEILFVGNSYTFGRVDPVMSYNASNVHDLTAGFNELNSTGTNPWEPHPWGGIAGIFKKLTDQAGLDYNVSISARNAATLRGQYLDTANPAWKLRENVASQKWDVVVLQEQSDAALPPGMGKNANLAQFNAYATQFEKFIHGTAATSYTETELYGSQAACMATGLSAVSCNTVRVIAANTNANADTKVYLTETWARPDMVFAHKVTKADTASPTGSPIVNPNAVTADNPQGLATLYYPTLAAMTADLRTSFNNAALANPNFAGVVAVGDAFQNAVDQNLVKTGSFYNEDGTFNPNQPGEPINLWWDDYLHASKYGSYLDALMQFGEITGLDPQSLGMNEIAARELGISASDAYILQQVAAETLGFQKIPEPTSVALMSVGLLGFMARRKRNVVSG